MNDGKFILLLGANIVDENEPFSRIDDLNEEELLQLLGVLLKKNIDILIRHSED